MTRKQSILLCALFLAFLWGFLLLGLFSNAVCALSLLFEDQLFRWQLSFRVADPGSAEPSEWEMFNRWSGWIVLTAVALLAYAGAAGLI